VYVALLLPGSVSLLRGQVIRALLWLGTSLALWTLLIWSGYLDGSAFYACVWWALLLMVHLLHWRNAVQAFVAQGQPLNEWLNQRASMALSAFTLGLLGMFMGAGLQVSLAWGVLMHLVNATLFWGFNWTQVIPQFVLVGFFGAVVGVVGFLLMRWGWSQERLHLQHLRERALIETAKASGGVVSVSDVALATGLSLAESRELLEELSTQRVIERVANSGGQLLYRVLASSD